VLRHVKEKTKRYVEYHSARCTYPACWVGKGLMQDGDTTARLRSSYGNSDDVYHFTLVVVGPFCA